MTESGDVVDLVTTLSEAHWDDIVQLYAEDQWFNFPKEMVELNKKFDWSRAVVAVNRHTDRVIGLLTWTEAPNASVHYVSTYLVASGYRGRGIGQRMWDEMMKRVIPGRILGIDANPDMAEKYRSRDFPYHSKHGAYLLSVSTASALTACKKLLDQATEDISQTQIIPFSEDLIDQLIVYDQAISGRHRESFLRVYFKMDYVTTKVAIRHGKVVGFCCRVPMHENTLKLGPFFGDSFEIGVALLSEMCDFTGHLASMRPQRDECPFLQFLLQHTDCEVKKATKRSFSRKCPDEDKVDRSRVFAYTAHSCQSDC